MAECGGDRQNAWGELIVQRMEDGRPADAELVDAYYTLCIPFYCEFLGDHWHTGWYAEHRPIGPRDQLAMEDRIAASAGIDSSHVVLDVGCGVGGPACHLAAATGARFHGLTPNAAQLERARRLATSKGLGHRVQFHQGFADRLPFDDGSVDVVLFFESACHFPDRSLFFTEVARVLSPGGRLAGEDWLAGPGARTPGGERLRRAVEANWAIPQLGELNDYVGDMQAAGLDVVDAVDLRTEMPLLRGFVARARDRAALSAERQATADPIRRKIIQGLEVLGEAAEHGAFTVGRFLAVKPVSP